MVWEAFVDLSASRQIGMIANPISYADIAAYRALTLEPLSAWDVRLIKRLDAAVLPILNPKKDGNTVSARDGAGVLSIIRNQGAKHRAKEAK